ncbi:Transcriptional adapter 3-B [Mizuhopecten yessoensis]|uniref:Transcriptional adapter 3-B n=1 Tax=Mizuhopecten yessoensis TaxID=6573 RepID=A0A210PG42_MIZYE|nr:Transcriptional adapter 3-B [Mizuhopecten yessoensis]
MKGKGKGIIDKDCPLQFPDLQPVDHATECPKYTAVLTRSEDEGIGLEELEVIQSDLETLLASAGLRLKQLEHEKQILVNWQDKKDKKGLTPGKVQPETPTSGKRGKVVEEKPSKKFKGATETSGKGAIHQTPTGPGRPKSKINQTKGEYDSAADSPIDLPKLPKNDAVNRFWVSVEPYCADITTEDIKVLEDLLISHQDDADFFKVPALGKHFSDRWAEEDLLEEQRDGAKINDRRRGNNNNHSGCPDVTTLLKKAEQSNVDESPFGPLTQRLVSALIEENIMTPMDDAMTELGGESADEAPAISPRALAKQLNIGNPIHLEKRIKRELEEQGILDMEEKVEDNPDDEILTELRQKQQDLKAISQHNIVVTKSLLERAKEEMKKQEIRKKLAAADAEVLDAYRKIQAARQKKKTPTKKEKDAAWKALKERDALVKVLASKNK